MSLMILLQRGTTKTVVVTASEKVTLPATVFTFTFTHDLTKAQVVISPAIDASPHPERYNSFDINAALFDNLDNGFYTYKVTDQGGNLLELGKMKLVGTKTSPVQYEDTPTDYTTYGN